MAFPYKMHKRAYEEYVDAYEWYENEQKGLGEKFIDTIDRRVEQICEHPEYYSRVHGSYRQVSIEGFPFTVVYKFFPKRKLIHISSIHHTSRNPRTKFRKEQ